MTRDKRLTALAEKTDTGCSPYYGMLPALIRERQYVSGIEIGVLFGGHAKAILQEPSMEMLIGIDPYKMYDQPVEGITCQEDFDWVNQYAQDRLMFENYIHMFATSDEAFSFIEGYGMIFDFVFIDGLHTYEQIIKDLDNYSKLIRLGGVIACHDYNHPNFPMLTVAIDDFAKKHKTEVIQKEFHAIYMDKTW